VKPPILLIDETDDPDEATGGEFYDSVEEICRYLEPWFVDERYVMLDATGVRLEIVRREYKPYEPLQLEPQGQPARPDIVRKFVSKEILTATSGHGAGLANLVPADLQSTPLEELWEIYRECTAWHKANPPPRRSLLEWLKWFFPKRNR
jgi:hypothetical protein